jgi:hypothetical protein
MVCFRRRTPRNSLGKVLKRELRDQAIDLVESALAFEKSA